MSRRPIAYVTRVETFSACHRLHCKGLSDEENRTIFGKCNNPNGHGHNYTLEVTVKGAIDSTTGMVMNITELKSIIHSSVMEVMDHKHLDKDVSIFRDSDLVSTTENLAVVIYDLVSPQLPANVSLHAVRIKETDKNIVEYRGEYGPE